MLELGAQPGNSLEKNQGDQGSPLPPLVSPAPPPPCPPALEHLSLPPQSPSTRLCQGTVGPKEAVRVGLCTQRMQSD